MPLDPRLQRIVDVATKELGVREMPIGSNRSPRIDQYRPEWKRRELEAADAAAKRAGKTVPVAGDSYCAWGVTWCWYQALGYHPLGRQVGSCYEMVRLALERCLYVSLDEIDEIKEAVDMLIGPYPGCAFVSLDEPFKMGPGPGHTGICARLSETCKEANTVEWNSGQRVRFGTKALLGTKIRGVILPLGVKPATEDWPRGLLATADINKLGTR